MAVFGSVHSDTHYKFAADLVWGIMLNDIPKEKQAQRLEEIMGALLIDLMGAVDLILSVYASSRHFI